MVNMVVQAKNQQDIALIKEVNDTLKALRQIRQPYDSMVDDIFKYIYHGRRLVTQDKKLKIGKTGENIYDGTALSAANLLTDGLTGHTISKSFNWFGYSLPQKVQLGKSGSRRLDSIPEVRRWLQDTEEAMYAAYLASNVYDIATDLVRDGATAGTAVVNGDEDIEGGRTIFSIPHFRENFIAENHLGQVDTYDREYCLTLKQLVEKFGYDKMVEGDLQFEKDYKSDRNKTRDVIHARFPRRDIDPQKMNGKNKPFASVWIQKDPEKLLLESGTSQQTFTVWRWRKNSDEWYGRSPAFDAFIDAMTSHQQGKSNLEAGHKMVNPPLVGPADLRGAVRRGPGGWTSLADPERAPRPLIENLQMPFSLEMQDRTREAIRDHFQVDFFLMLSQAALRKVELTATQVIEMSGEKAAVLGPRIGRLETEALTPINDILFENERKAGRIPQPPDILAEFGGAKIEIQYLGPLAQAQRKLFRSQPIRQGLEAIAGVSEFASEVLDNIDFDKTSLDILDSVGFPQKNLRPEDDVKEIRRIRQAKIAQDEQFQQTIDAAKAMPAAGKAIDPTSAAGRIIEEAEQ